MIGHVIGWRMSSECSDDGWAGGEGRRRFWKIVCGSAMLHLCKLHRQRGGSTETDRGLGEMSV